MFGVAYGEKYRFESPTARNPTKSKQNLTTKSIVVMC